MALGGISGSDLKAFGFNTLVCAGVVGGCTAVAWLVKKFALMGFARFAPVKTTTAKEESDAAKARHEKYASVFGMLVGVGVSVAAYKFMPTSRFALVADDKALKLGIIQFLVGFIFDCYFTKGFYSGMTLGIGSAVATRFAPLALPVAGLGIYGAAMGAGYLQRPVQEANQ
ncbi:MAG TPA: hypothetical protein VFU89_05715 [Rhabdochlamydiaceae bacterium]|nr:hypothetical protein [Rhabdochlamydiaceae bacterium]